MSNILVIGGAGYIGSHCVRHILELGHTPIILDNLIYGHRESLPNGLSFYEGDLGDRSMTDQIFKEHKIDIVMHFAAFAYVGESHYEPMKYYKNNVAATINLLDSMIENGVKKFVFSSSCATFGTHEKLPITEESAQNPINPYGHSKLAIEHLLRALCDVNKLSCAVFRYFNAAGAHEDGAIGEHHDPECHLIPLAIEAATGGRPALQIFGDDYPTPDGTCVRDYVHVNDLSRAHTAVFDRLDEDGTFLDYNLGTGNPTSVKEIIDAVESVTGLTVPHSISERRPGDPPTLYADSTKARKELAWQPHYANIKEMIETAWNWHKNHPEGYHSPTFKTNN